MSFFKEKTVEAVKTAKNEVMEDLKNETVELMPKIFVGSVALLVIGAALGSAFGRRVNLHIYVHNKRR